MASKSKKIESKAKKTATKSPAKAKAKVAVKKAAPPKAPKRAAAKAAPQKEAVVVPKKLSMPKEGLTAAYTKEVKSSSIKSVAKTLTKSAPVVALSKILPKEELAASYELADSEVDDFEEDEKARTVLEEVEEDVEGPPEWWKDDPAAIEGPEEEGDKAEFDDSDEWTEDDEWTDDEKKSDADSDVDDDRDW